MFDGSSKNMKELNPLCHPRAYFDVNLLQSFAGGRRDNANLFYIHSTFPRKGQLIFMAQFAKLAGTLNGISEIFRLIGIKVKEFRKQLIPYCLVPFFFCLLIKAMLDLCAVISIYSTFSNVFAKNTAISLTVRVNFMD